MMTRAIVLAVSLALIGTAPAYADTQKEKLRQLLEKEFGSKSSSKTRSTKPSDGDDLYVIDPSGKVRRLPSSKKDGGRSMLPTGTNNTLARSQIRLPIGGAAASEPPSAARTYARPETESELKPVYASDKSSGMVVDQNIIVIQFKPGTEISEIKALMDKYELMLEGPPLSSLGAIYVKLKPQARAKMRSLAPQAPGSVQSLLEPPIVLQLRNEPSVNACFVKTTVAPQGLPRQSKVKIRRGQKFVRWHWETDRDDDGNWGLKSMRMPPVWTILSRIRRARGTSQTARVAILDSGFGRSPHLKYANVASPLPASIGPVNCATGHGTHVAGIIGADSGSHTGLDRGIDGIVPNARLDLIPISKNLMLEGAMEGRQRSQLHLSYFADVIRDLAEYFDGFPLLEGERRVVNVSLAYNWGWVGRRGVSDPTADQSIRNQISQHANFIQYLVNRENKQVLFVAAAGNDSSDTARPLNAELATPFGFAALHNSSFFTPSTNILVVEAHNRSSARAAFSNMGGHIAAPGVDVMSTLASDDTPYALCSGTSQAAPHVAALAAILFELKPAATPGEIAKLITSSAASDAATSATPRVDALAAVLNLSDSHLGQLADLNGDGKVDARDLERFKTDLTHIEGGRFGEPINKDLNGDGSIDDTERCWPSIDLNGSGRASFDASDKRRIGGAMRSDLDVIEVAWADQTQTFGEAMATSRLSELIDVWRETSLIAAAPALRQTAPCQ